ncbi:hypothetical protein FRC07_004149 [Ceratobasidium sp. 392]|nr:hypothetical protein FRC07_004149 [Ceratobasidium sp. 392]
MAPQTRTRARARSGVQASATEGVTSATSAGNVVFKSTKSKARKRVRTNNSRSKAPAKSLVKAAQGQRKTSTSEKSDIVVTLADCEDKLLHEYEQPQDDLLFPREKFLERRWVRAVLGLQFSVHVGYDGVEPPYPDVGWLNITVYFDDVRVSDAFISPGGIALRAEQKQLRRAAGRKKKRIGKNKALTDEQLDELEGIPKPDNLIFGETEIPGSPGDAGMMAPFYFAARRQAAEDKTHWGNTEFLGQIRVDVRWAKVTTGLSGSMKRMYHELWKLQEPVGRPYVEEHRLAARVDLERLDLGIKFERESEGGYRFTSEPLDDKVYRFIFHYADERTLVAKGFKRTRA